MTQSRGKVPKKIDRYEILEAVGHGAMGAVYRAFDPLIKRPVALKTIRLDVPKESPDHRAFLDRFTTEARTAGRLSHPNIITLYDVGHTEDQLPWLAMEFVEGETVEQMLAKGSLGPEMVVGLVSQIAAAIDFAHSEGVIHRDIKPSNVLVYAGEKVKVTDFGIAKLMDGEITHSGFMMGTPSYMSPEQAMGEELDGKTDIFSLGVVAFEMLSGKQPFPGNNVTSILYKLVHADPVHPDNLEVLGLLPDKWHDVFAKVLAKERAARYATAAAFVRDLELCLGSWFGALEGETVIVTDPEKIAALTGRPAQDPEPDGDDAWRAEEAVEPTAILDSREAGVVPPADSSSAAGEDAQGEIDADDQTMVVPPPSFPGAAPGVVGPEPEGEVDETIVVSDPGSAARSEPAQAGEVNPEAKTVSDRDAAAELFDAVTEQTSQAAPPTPPAPPSGTGGSPLSQPGTPRRETTGEAASTASSPATVTEPQRKPRVAKVAESRKSPPYLWMAAAGIGVALLVTVAVLVLRSGGGETPVVPTQSARALPPPVLSGSLIVTTEPPEATVWINGAELGLTPLEMTDVPYGAVLLRVEKDGFEPQDFEADLSEEASDASFELTLTPVARRPSPAFIQVTSVPEGAVVQVDGEEVGTTPTEQVQVRVGDRSIRVVLEGFFPWEDTVRARAGATEALTAELTARRPVEPEPEPQPEPEPEPEVRLGDLVERGAPGVTNPKCIRCPAVRYPEAAKRAGLSGVVELSYLIDENGRVSELQVVQSGGEIFDNAVVENVSEWQYEPATKLGVRVKMRWIQRFRFEQGR